MEVQSGFGKIKLTEKDEQIFKFVLEIKEALQLKTVFRVAGGWVRDKLLDKDSNDIDIALDDMTGEKFVQIAQEYHQQKNPGEKVIGGFGVTKLNPEKSKHLETATLKIFGEWIDLVNLRAEEYTDSRVPIIKIGTPTEDAFRRDLTINALFYNINEQKIEDYTQKGLSDLKEGIIRTPMQPSQTFLDDPLRILRCFRFATRFNYVIQPEIFQSLQLPEVKVALEKKVSKERVGVELKLVLQNTQKDPIKVILDYMAYIYNNNLYNSIFSIPQYASFEHQPLSSHYQESYQLMQSALNNLDFLKEYSIIDVIPVEQMRLIIIMSAATSPFSQYSVKKNKGYSSCSAGIIKESLKFDNDLSKQVNLVVSESFNAKNLLNSVSDLDKTIEFIQQGQQYWELSVYLAFLELLGNEEIEKSKEKVRKLVRLIEENSLQSIFGMKCVLDGNKVVKTFGLSKRGPIVNTIMKNVILYQIVNQDLTPQQQLTYIHSHLDQFNPSSPNI